MSNNKPLIAAILELGAGYFGLMGLGWIFAGDILRGILLLIGYMVFLAVGGALVVFSGGCLAIIIAPLYIVAPLVSAVKVYEFAGEWH